MEGCGAHTVECCSLGKAICTINTTIRHPGVEHVSLLFIFVSIFSCGTDCDYNALVKKIVAPKPPLPINNGAQDYALFKTRLNKTVCQNHRILTGDWHVVGK